MHTRPTIHVAISKRAMHRTAAAEMRMKRAVADGGGRGDGGAQRRRPRRRRSAEYGRHGIRGAPRPLKPVSGRRLPATAAMAVRLPAGRRRRRVRIQLVRVVARVLLEHLDTSLLHDTHTQPQPPHTQKLSNLIIYYLFTKTTFTIFIYIKFNLTKSKSRSEEMRRRS